MFEAKTEKIEKISKKFPEKILELEKIFDKKTNIYIDFANVIPWQNKLKWKIDIKRMYKFFSSFKNINKIKFYYGTLNGDKSSEDLVKQIKECGYELITKPVKIMKKSIDVSSIKIDSISILENFIRKTFLKELKISDIEYLNTRLSEINSLGKVFIEDRKCNFDVEMGSDILIDLNFESCENFILWTGDSDFESVIGKILEKNKKIYVFSVVRRVSREIANSGAKIYDIAKTKNFICRNPDIDPGIF